VRVPCIKGWFVQVLDEEERLAATPGFRLWCERDEEERIFMLAQNNFTASFRLIPGWDQRTGRRMVKNQWL